MQKTLIVVSLAAFLSLGSVGADVACCVFADDGTRERPNFVVVFIDDMGWADLSCFGNVKARTPNIDRLAAEGLRFEQFYVNSPICSPSRVAISTGQYPQRWQITSFLSNREANERRGMAQWLDPDAPMLARILQDGGYATGHFGKWHMGGQRNVGEAPVISEYGFDETLTNFEGLGPRVLPLLDAYDGTPIARHSLGSDKLKRGPIQWAQRDDVTAHFVKAAVGFIEESQRNGRAFYVNVWPDDVHSPFFPPKERAKLDSKRDRYLAVLGNMDKQLGALFRRIRDDEQLRQNTLILLCSDNGPEGGAGSAGPFRGTKGELYEGGIRSPLVVWGPGYISADQRGSINEAMYFSAIDIPPTLLDIAGQNPPAKTRFDGAPITKVLTGEAASAASRPIFFRRPPDRPRDPADANLPDLAVRDGNWKLLCEYDGTKPELYDLASDPGETMNRAADFPTRVERLSKSLLDWHMSMPPDNGPMMRSSNKRMRGRRTAAGDDRK